MVISRHKGKEKDHGRRSRSFRGCSTCRSRHLKCDETQPTCTTCHDTGLACGGYERGVFFDTDESPSSSALRFRRPLFTEEERKCMSEALLTSVPANLALWNIEQIDQQCEKASQADEFQVCKGPFGAFRQSKRQAARTSALRNNIAHEAEALTELPASNSDSFSCTDLALLPRAQQEFGSIFDESMPSIFTPPNIDLWDFPNGTSRVEEILDFEFPSTSFQQTTTMPFPTADLDTYHTTQTADLQQFTLSNTPDILSLPPRAEVSLPHDAVFLIKHYSTTVLRLLTPFRHTKTPWHILFVPHAKACLAGLTLGESLDDASLCAFYGMLAISAFSLSGVSDSQTWLDTGKSYKNKAKKYGMQMLQKAYDIPKTAKYKSILVALLTMVQLFMISGDPEQTDCYFLEAERFIRVKGLNRKKSRKVRLLHHCYAFERMFHESTFVSGLNSSHRSHTRRAIESSGAIAYSHDSLTFRLGDWSDLDNEMARMKSKEEGENDLHLELPGVWSATLYPEIFGVPEVFIFVLSLTIRLGEQKDAVEQQTTNAPLGLKEFLSRAKAVERCINSLRDYTPTQAGKASETAPISLKTILIAMQNALAIYFYRRIYDVDAELLKPKVEVVQKCLSSLEPIEMDSWYGAARLIWPAFIAGCESEEPVVRIAIANWFERSAVSSGLRLFTDAKASMERIWAQKLGTETGNASWFDLLKTDHQSIAAF